MDEKGVYAIARFIWDDPDFADAEYSQREAWMWLIGAAAWKEVRIRVNGRPIALKRGEFAFSVRFLAERFGWSKSRVERFISALKNRDTIRDVSRDGSTVYSIRKYNEFQVVGLPKRDTDQDTIRDSSGTAAGQQRDKEETLETLEALNSKEERAPASAAAPSKPPSPRAARWPSDKPVPVEWVQAVRDRFRELGRPPPDFAIEAVKFANHWASKSGKDGLKLDWKKTFENWCLNARSTEQRSFAERKFDNLVGGAAGAAVMDRQPGQGVESPRDNLVRLAISAKP